MAISNAEFMLWLKSHSARRVVLLETESWYQGAAGARYLSDRGYTSGPTDVPANTTYPARIKSVPMFAITMEAQLAGTTTPARGQIVIRNDDGALDTYLRHAWDGREFALYIGDPTWARSDFRKMLGGVIEDITVPTREDIALVILDLRAKLRGPLSSSVIAGGPNINRLKPVCYGEVYNITPVMVDEASKKYAVHDGQIEDIVAVRQNGVTASFSEQLADGTFTLTSAATGTITCDVKGAKSGSTYYTNTADIISNIITTRTDFTASDLHTASFAAFETAQPATVGLYVEDGAQPVLSALDALTLGAGAWFGFDRTGLMRVGIVDVPGAWVADITQDDIYRNSFKLLSRLIPRERVTLGYKKRYTVQSSLDASVTGATRVMYQTPYDYTSATNTIDGHLLAGTNEQSDGTLFVAAPTAEVTRRAALAEQIRYVFEIAIAAGAVNVQLGDTVRVTHPRYGFASGQTAVVIGIEENPPERVTRLILWR